MTDETPREEPKKASGYHGGGVDSVISVEEVNRQAIAMAEPISLEKLDDLAGNKPHVSIKNLVAGYGQMEILHDFDLRVGKGQSLCLIGPNGAGKSTILHAIFGFNRIFSGSIEISTDGVTRNVTRMTPNQKLAEAGIAYILQDKSIFPNMKGRSTA